MTKIKGIIFDLDGVLCHTDHLHYKAWKTIADEKGMEFNEEINNQLRGVSRMASLEIILNHNELQMSEEEKDLLAHKKNEAYKIYLNALSPKEASENVVRTLTLLKERGFLLAIGSSSRNAKLILERLGLTHFFNAISDGTNISNSKPDPEVFIKAAEMMGLTPEVCLVVEDAKVGIDAAATGGFHNAGISDAMDYEMTENKLKIFEDLLQIL